MGKETLIPIYQTEIDSIKEIMLKAQKFAKEIPSLADIIIKQKITGENPYIKFGERYKDMYLSWGINLQFYTKDRITNYNSEFDGEKRLFNIYFNSISLYNCHNDYGIEKLGDIEGVFFYDELNTTFYVEPHAIGPFLDAANEWYLEGSKKALESKKQKQIEDLSKQLEKLTS